MFAIWRNFCTAARRTARIFSKLARPAKFCGGKRPSRLVPAATLALITPSGPGPGNRECGGERVWTAFDWPLFAEKARAAPNQQAFPAVDYYLNASGVTKFALLGTDYVYPRTTNNILAADLIGMGIAQEDIFVNYTPFGHSDWSKIVGDVVALGADGKEVGVISTINGDANIGIYKEMVTAGALPVVAFLVGEEELSGLDTSNLAGHLAMLSAMR